MEVSVSELKVNMRDVLDDVEFRGKTYQIMRQGRPVAVIASIPPRSDDKQKG